MNGTEIYKFRAKDSEIVARPLCLGNISKDWSIDNMKKNLIKDLFGALVIVSVNVIKRVILVNISTMKIVSAEKS